MRQNNLSHRKTVVNYASKQASKHLEATDAFKNFNFFV
jgi:hypothetical protein